MVLQDVNETAPDSFSDNPYPDQNDPYASSSSPSTYSGARFDPTGLPQPLPVIGTFMGFSDRAVQYKTETTLKFAERKLGRQLYPNESQALAYHIYQLEQTKSYFAASGAVAGTYRAYATMGTMRYPFYQPKIESMDPNKFAFLRGPMAQVGRHVWRFSLYVLVAGQMGSIIGQLIAQPLAAVNTSNDPKLEQFGNELKAAAAAETTKTSAQGREIQDRRREFERQTRDPNNMGPSPQARWGKQPSAQTSEEDMSPTAGNEAWGSQSSATGAWDSFSSQADQNMPRQSQGPPSNEQRNRRRAPQASSSPFDDDDASPTGGLFQDEVNNSSQAQEQARPGESTWDRLRRGGAPIPGQRPSQPTRRAEPERREQRDSSTLGDSFTFVEGEEERKREKERAQREFDERIERERQGRDFTSDEGKRW
jgi:hypothetical protein